MGEKVVASKVGDVQRDPAQMTYQRAVVHADPAETSVYYIMKNLQPQVQCHGSNSYLIHRERRNYYFLHSV